MAIFTQKLQDIIKKFQDKTAVCCLETDTSLSYEDLHNQAKRVSFVLKNNGIGTEDIVAIHLEKSSDYIVAMIGCWYAGAAFIPLPPHIPKERKDFILEDSNAKTMISKSHEVYAPKIDKINIDHLPDETISPLSNQPKDLAYVVYTSGTTGTPKGVMVEHKGLVNVIEQQIKAFKITSETRSLFYLSIQFDAAISDIGVALLSGSTLYIPKSDITDSFSNLVNVIQYNKISYADLPPALLSAIDPDDVDSLKSITIGGEVCNIDTVKKWSDKVHLTNVYGPTESTICTSMIVCHKETFKEGTIGFPLENIDYIIADNKELLISGIGLARGFLNKPELTKDKFMTVNGIRYYRTGDIVEKSVSGEFVFKGRIDRQIKFNGRLIAPEEIENRIKDVNGVLDVAVVKRPINLENGKPQLVAFYSANKNISPDDIKQKLSFSIQNWMVPSLVIKLNNFPKTHTGKPRFESLRTLQIHQDIQSENESISLIEKDIITIWKDILKLDQISRKDGFSYLGGDSINALQFTFEMEKMGYAITASILARYDTPERIAKWLENGVIHDNDLSKISAEELRKRAELSKEETALFGSVNTKPNTKLDFLLTGATGFLGSQVLINLNKKTDKTIYCLIRSQDTDHAIKRLQNTLIKYCAEDLPQLNWNKIKVICGDLSKEKLGLEENIYEDMLEKIGAVYHCAAEVNVVKDYEELEKSNFITTRNVARFCAEKRPKFLHYASTLSVFVSTDKNIGIAKETDQLDDINFIYGGYAQTKWASEYYLHQIEKLSSFPISHYRFGLLTGHTKSGIAAEQDFLTMYIQGIKKIGALPSLDTDIAVDITPIDYAAEAMVQISILDNETNVGNIYHVANTSSLGFKALSGFITKKKKDIKELPLNEWNTLVKNNISDSQTASVFLGLCRQYDPENFERFRTMDLFQATDIKFDNTNTREKFSKPCPEINSSLIEKYLERAGL